MAGFSGCDSSEITQTSLCSKESGEIVTIFADIFFFEILVRVSSDYVKWVSKGGPILASTLPYFYGVGFM